MIKIRPQQVALLLLLVGGFFISSINVQQDDAYIFYTYAQNIAAGNGYVFNIGDPINATTSPLYTLILAILFRIFQILPNDVLPIIGNLLSAVSLFIFLFVFILILKKENIVRAAWVFPLAFIMNSSLRNAVGMETLITLALVALVFFTYQSKRLAWVAIWGSLAVLSRPDTLLVLVVVGLDWLYHNRRMPPIKLILIFVSIVGIWAGFSYYYFGSIFPTTLSAKLGQSSAGFWGDGLLFLQGLYNTLPSIERHNFIFSIIYILLVGAGICIILFRWRKIRSYIVFLILLWQVLYVLTYGLVLNPPAYEWYYVPLMVTPALLIALAVQVIGKPTSPPKVPLNFLILLTITSFFIEGVMPVTPKYTRYRAGAEWVNQHAQVGDTVGINEIGIVGYFYTQGTIIDTLGLVTPDIAPHIALRDFGWGIRHYEPDFLLLSISLDRRNIMEEHYINTEWFNEKYMLRDSITMNDDLTLLIYEFHIDRNLQ